MTLLKYLLDDRAKAAAAMLPCGDSLVAYFEKRRPPGDFMAALLSNDLIEAFNRADDRNIACMHEYVRWLYNNPPGRAPWCWGSPEAVRFWVAGKNPDWFEAELAEQEPEHADDLAPERSG